MTLQVTILPVTSLRQNCSIIWCDETGRGAIVDPGGDAEQIIEAVAATKMKPELVLITHGHFDHAGSASVIAEKFDIPIEGPHLEDKFMIDGMAEQAVMFDAPWCLPFSPTRWLEGGDRVKFGNVELDVLHCPGHTPGHVVFYDKGTKLAFVGDVIFKGSVGRTDFIKGDHQALVSSIRDRLFPLGDDVTFVPGHGPNSTFGEERKSNPFVGDDVIG